MQNGFNSVLRNSALWGGRALVVLIMGMAGFVAGLVLLSLADDLLQYQARFPARTILYFGLGFSVFSALVCMGAGYRLLMRRAR